MKCVCHDLLKERRKEMFYLTMHSTHFIYGYMASHIWYRTTQIAREETRRRHMGYSFRLAARVLLYASSHRQDNTYHGHCYTSRGALAGTRNSLKERMHKTPNTLNHLCTSFYYLYFVVTCVSITTVFF